MLKKYVEPELEIIRLTEDIVTASSWTAPGLDLDGDGEIDEFFDGRSNLRSSN